MQGFFDINNMNKEEKIDDVTGFEQELQLKTNSKYLNNFISLLNK